MKQKVVIKKKKELKEKSKDKLALHLLLKQLEVLKLKEYILLAGFMLGGALLRVPMQAVPSAEPITFFAMLAGWLFGRKKGFLTGVGALYISNFLVLGGHGIWTLFQGVGFGMAGFLGGYLRKKAKLFEVITVVAIATIAYEVILNFGSFLFIPFSIFRCKTIVKTTLKVILLHFFRISIVKFI